MPAKLMLETALLPDGWASNVLVTIADGRFESVTAAGRRPADAELVPGFALPGMPNLHSHAFQRGMAGLSERRGASEDSFWTWRALMYSFLEKLTPDDVEAIAALAYVEMLEAGFTSCTEFHYLHHDFDGRPFANIAEMAERIAAAAAASGIGLTLLPVLYRYGGFGGVAPGTGQRRFISTPDSYARLVEASRQAIAPLCNPGFGLAPHSLRAVAIDDLQRIIGLRRVGEPVHIHIAEQTKEVEDCLAWSGRRPVDWLMHETSIGPDWCLIHATHLSAGELPALANSGAVAGLCPVTEANLGDGIFEASAFLRQGGSFGVGTDSNVRIDLAEELRTLEYGQRLSRRQRNVLGRENASTGSAIFKRALAGGARASGRKIGKIAPGFQADIVTLSSERLGNYAASAENALDIWIFASPKSSVSEVFANGVRLVSEGRHVAREAAERRFKTVMRRLLA